MTWRIALAQINPTVGDISGNLELHREILSQVGDNADIIIFPECSLPGYPAQDLLFEQSFLRDLASALMELAKVVADRWVIVGTVRREGGALYNTAVVLHDGELFGWHDKSLLPTYDVFDEARYFTPARKIEPLVLHNTKGAQLRIGLHICEDLWDQVYEKKVCDILGEQEIDLFVNISASPFRVDRDPRRRELISEKVRRWRKPFIYCNLVGGQDELVFDGRSLVFDERSQLCEVGNAFQEDLFVIKFPFEEVAAKSSSPIHREEELSAAIRLGIRDYFKKTRHQEAVVGLSGGIDSSLVAVLAVQALGPENVLGISMPTSFNQPESEEDARLLAKNLGIRVEVLPIETLRITMLDVLEPFFKGSEPGIAEENLQSRLRGSILMAIANKRDALVLTTGNKTEVGLGYTTLYGDMAGALAPIGDVSKIDVYRLATFVNEDGDQNLIPDRVIAKTPSAELRDDQVDPFDYEVVSPLVDELVVNRASNADLEAEEYDRELIVHIRKLMVSAEYKRRQAAPLIRVTGKAFGIGRRYPIVNHYVE
ncbi:NAD+ synthase [Candidatus Neomarinimicrobiota bacterium]